MKNWLLRSLAACLLILILLAFPAFHFLVRGETNVIIIDRADATNTLNMSGSPGLTTLIQTVQTRIVLQYANSTNTIPISAPSAALVSLIQSVQDRVKLQYANESTTFPITPVPAGLTALIQSVQDRFIIQHANATRTYPLTYPFGVINDLTPPLVSNISTNITGGSLTLTITTSEYSIAQLELGASPGNYTITLGDDLYRTQHVFAPTGLQSGQTYYYRLTLTDRSNNQVVTPETTLRLANRLFLPVLKRLQP